MTAPSQLDLGQVLQWVQIGLILSGLLGGFFTAGRLFERMANVKDDVHKLETRLFGPDGQGGLFLFRSEAALMLENANRARAEFDNRLTDLSNRLGRVEARGGGLGPTD